MFKMQEARIDWNRVFRWQILALRVTGLWPKADRPYGLNLYTLHMILSMLIFLIIFASFQTINLYFIIDDLKAVTGTVFLLVTVIGCCLKTFNLVRNIKKLKHLMATLNHDIFQPRNMEQKDLISPNIWVWRMTVSAFWSSSCVCMTLMALFPILDKSYKQYRLPFFSWYPYNIKTSPQYELTYIYQIMAIVFVALVNITIDSMIAFFNMYVGSQFDILWDDLRNLHDSATNLSDNINKKLKKCILHHREILKFAAYANQFYNWLLFVQFFASGIAIGMAMFQLTVVKPFSSEFHYLLTYASAALSEIFMYCWFGNEVQIKSSRLPYAVFESDWTGLSTEVRKNLIIFVIRLQKSLRISSFGLFYLSLETFVKILRTAWSCFALLRQVNQPKQ